jgi:hypothetical protein
LTSNGARDLFLRGKSENGLLKGHDLGSGNSKDVADVG